MPKSATHRVLAQLVAQGWVEQDRTTEFYRLSLRLGLLGHSMLLRLNVTELYRPILRKLAEQTTELVRLTAVQGDRLVWIDSVRGRQTGLVYEPIIAERIRLHATANGKVWLASLELDAALRIVMRDGFGSAEELGPRTITTAEALIQDLRLTRERGWGLADEEALAGVAAVAVGVADRSDAATLVGTVSVAGPILRMTQERIREILPALRSAAAELCPAWPGAQGWAITDRGGSEGCLKWQCARLMRRPACRRAMLSGSTCSRSASASTSGAPAPWRWIRSA